MNLNSTFTTSIGIWHTKCTVLYKYHWNLFILATWTSWNMKKVVHLNLKQCYIKFWQMVWITNKLIRSLQNVQNLSSFTTLNISYGRKKSVLLCIEGFYSNILWKWMEMEFASLLSYVFILLSSNLHTPDLLGKSNKNLLIYLYFIFIHSLF